MSSELDISSQREDIFPELSAIFLWHRQDPPSHLDMSSSDKLLLFLSSTRDSWTLT